LKATTLREMRRFGIFGHPDAAAITALIARLQHRGQEAAGIVSSTEADFTREAARLVRRQLLRREVIDRLPGTRRSGHVRYSTTGETILRTSSRCSPNSMPAARGRP